MYPSKEQPNYGIFVKNFEEQLQSRNINIKRRSIISGRGKSYTHKLFKYFFFYFSILINGFANDYDLVYSHYITHTSIPLFFLKLFGKKIVVNVHGSDIIDGDCIEKLLRFFARIILPKSDLVVAPSDFFKKLLIDEFKVSEKNILVSPSGGVNLNIFRIISKEEAKIKLFDDKQKFVFGYVSRIEKNKGWDIFLKAAQIIKNNYPQINFKAVIVGNGQMAENMMELAEKYDLKSVMRYIKIVRHEDLSLIYNACDVFIFPTELKESLGLVGIEAMACGTPVIGSEIGGLKDYLKNNYNGYFFKSGDFVELAENIVKFYNLSELQKKDMSVNALTTAAKFDSSIVTTELTTRLLELLSLKTSTETLNL